MAPRTDPARPARSSLDGIEKGGGEEDLLRSFPHGVGESRHLNAAVDAIASNPDAVSQAEGTSSPPSTERGIPGKTRRHLRRPSRKNGPTRKTVDSSAFPPDLAIDRGPAHPIRKEKMRGVRGVVSASFAAGPVTETQGDHLDFGSLPHMSEEENEDVDADIDALYRAEDEQWALVHAASGDQRALEDVDYWRQRAGWYDDDISMKDYNKGVYDTYYSLDDMYVGDDGSSKKKSGGGASSVRAKFSGKAFGKAASTGVKVVLAVLAVGLIIMVIRALRRRQASEVDSVSDRDKKSKRSKDRDDDRHGSSASRREKSKSGSAASRSSSRRRSSSRARSKSDSGASRSRSKSVTRSRSSRSRSRSRRAKGADGDYELMDEEDGARSTRTGRSSRSRSRSKRKSSRSRSKARRSDKEEMLV